MELPSETQTQAPLQLHTGNEKSSSK